MWTYELRRENDRWNLHVLKSGKQLHLPSYQVDNSELCSPFDIVEPLISRDHVSNFRALLEGRNIAWREYDRLAMSDDDDDIEALASIRFTLDSQVDPLTLTGFLRILLGKRAQPKRGVTEMRFTRPKSKKFVLTSWEYQTP